jgi:ATP-dependent DNA helicase RecG
MDDPRQIDLLEYLLAIGRSPLDALLTADQIFESNDPALFTRLMEDARFERKGPGIQPAGLGPAFSAFSNGPSIGGGVIAVGVEDKTKKLLGCRRLSDDRLQGIESAHHMHCSLARVRSRRLPFTDEDGEDDFLVLLRVDYAPDRLIELNNSDAYQRHADKCVRLDDASKHQVRVGKGERSFEQEPCILEYPKDLDVAETRRLCSHLREVRQSVVDHSDVDILDAVRLGRKRGGDFVPNNACALLFGRDPRRLFPGAYVHFLRYEGTEEKSGQEYNVIKDRIVEGNIILVIKEAAQILDANIREFTEWKAGKFFTIPEYPHDAWYELLVNACVHRSYMVKNIPILIKMFDDRLVIESPGGFMPGVTPDTIYERHNPRNPFIMATLRETGEVKCINEGTKRVRSEMERAKLPAPVFFEKKGDNASFVATLQNNIRGRSNSLDSKAYQVLGEAISLSLTPDERKIVNYVMANDRINASDALRILVTTRWHTAKGKLDALVARGILVYHSSKSRDPNSYYDLMRLESSGEADAHASAQNP